MSREVTVFRNIKFKAWIDKEFVAFPLAFMRVVYNKTANFKGVKKMKRSCESTTIAFFVFHFNIFQTFPKAKWYTPRKEDA